MTTIRKRSNFFVAIIVPALACLFMLFEYMGLRGNITSVETTLFALVSVAFVCIAGMVAESFYPVDTIEDDTPLSVYEFIRRMDAQIEEWNFYYSKSIDREYRLFYKSAISAASQCLIEASAFDSIREAHEMAVIKLRDSFSLTIKDFKDKPFLKNRKEIVCSIKGIRHGYRTAIKIILQYD